MDAIYNAACFKKTAAQLYVIDTLSFASVHIDFITFLTKP